jgi:hypothetical protein
MPAIVTPARAVAPMTACPSRAVGVSRRAAPDRHRFHDAGRKAAPVRSTVAAISAKNDQWMMALAASNRMAGTIALRFSSDSATGTEAARNTASMNIVSM